MHFSFTILIFLLSFTFSQAQNIYFPPRIGNQWDTLSPSSLGYCPNQIDSLYDYLEKTDSRAFILLKDGKIVLEKYFGTFTQDSVWYWASAGKTMTAYLVGIAQQENYLDINDTSSTYLGTGWTSCTPTQEAQITIRHQLSMTTGLDFNAAPLDCTDDTCLQYLAPPETKWAYHNAPYTLLDQVIENATGSSINNYFAQKIAFRTGMTGSYFRLGYNNVFFSKPRSMARFGLLTLNEGNWDGTAVLSDTAYFRQMVNSSQNINLSYGYLWWLNGKSSYMLPQLQFTFNGSFSPNAPTDAIMALGKNGQILNVVPSENLVWIRMGDSPNNKLIQDDYADSIWIEINKLNCSILSTNSTLSESNISVELAPTPTSQGSVIKIHTQAEIEQIEIYHPTGQLVYQQVGNQKNIPTANLPTGIHAVSIRFANQTFLTKRIIIQ